MDRSSLTAVTGRRKVVPLAVAILVIAGVQMSLEDDDLARLGVTFLAIWALCLWMLVLRNSGGIYSPSAAYLVLFGLFHGGMLLSIVLRGEDAYTAYDVSWMYRGYTAQAVQLVILGMVAFTLASGLAGGSRAAPALLPHDPGGQRPALAVAGLGLQFTGLVIFGNAVVHAGGFAELSGGYSAYMEANQADGALGYGILFAGIGPVLAIAAGGRARVVAWVAFTAYGVVALLVGTRGSVLFPLLTLAVVEVWMGRRPRRLFTAVGALSVLTAIGLVREARSTGLSALSSLTSPMDAIAEMGYSLRPTVAVLDWHTRGEPFRNGETLFAVPIRFMERLTGWHGRQPAYDDRLFNVEILERVGPIGGSPIAEGYHNFGSVGVVLFMAAIGLTLGALHRAPRTPLGGALIGVVLLPLLVQVRNFFGPVPVQLALGLLVLVLVHLWSSRAARRPADIAGGADRE